MNLSAATAINILSIHDLFSFRSIGIFCSSNISFSFTKLNIWCWFFSPSAVLQSFATHSYWILLFILPLSLSLCLIRFDLRIICIYYFPPGRFFYVLYIFARDGYSCIVYSTHCIMLPSSTIHSARLLCIVRLLVVPLWFIWLCVGPDKAEKKNTSMGHGRVCGWQCWGFGRVFGWPHFISLKSIGVPPCALRILYCLRARAPIDRLANDAEKINYTKHGGIPAMCANLNSSAQASPLRCNVRCKSDGWLCDIWERIGVRWMACGRCIRSRFWFPTQNRDFFLWRAQQ